MTGRTRRWLVAGAAAALPLVVALAVVLTFAALEGAGRPVLTYDPPRNLAEAAAMGRGHEVLRRLRAGEDPQAIQPVGPEAISASVPLATALEAAVWGRRVEIVRLLVREGALTLPAPEHLACLAVDLAVADVAEYLAAPDGGPVCEPGAAVARVTARGG